MRALLRLAILLVLPAPLLAQRAVPTPASVLGFQPGADRKLPSWEQITDYFAALDAASPRVTVRTLGKTTLGRPFIAAFIADSATLANLEHYRGIQRRLMDPRLRTGGDAERQRLIDEGKNVILITSSIHSTEVGGITTPLLLAERLARGDTPEAREILANTIIMLVPSQNPDGVDIVGKWYTSTMGTPREGSGPPDLYHYYTGHDDNRDWYAFTQVETRYTVDSLYTPWDPQIVNDIHQQGSGAGRIFLPPYMDPVDPNIDPILTGATNAMGMSMGWRMIADGFTGVASNASYDQWSPARQYSLYHRGARLLTETASARLATPIDIPFDRLGEGRGYNAQTSTWNFPALWTGGKWTYADIVRYQVEASWALLIEAASDRKGWLTSYAALGDRAVGDLPAWGREAWPSAFIIPKAQPDAEALHRLLWSLQHGQVEIRETQAATSVDGKTYPVGSYVVLTRQPFGGYAKTMLERQDYPNLYEYPGGPPKRPYDVTAQTLPLLFGVDVATVTGAAPAAGAPIAALPDVTYSTPLSGKSSPRIAIFRRSASESSDNGWTRWIFDVSHVPFTQITEKDLASGNLANRFDAIIMPDERANQLTRAIGDAGATNLAAFVDAGGNLLAFNSASEYAIAALDLPVKNSLDGVSSTDFYAPGSILSVNLNRSHPMTRTFTATIPAVWFQNSPAFEITDPTHATAVATYAPTGNALLSGWLLGADRLHGKAALVDVSRGKGHVILFGFKPQYRAQTMVTYPLIWTAITE